MFYLNMSTWIRAIYIYICIDIFHNGVSRDVVVIAE